jgi:uncharacterized phage-associated protein
LISSEDFKFGNTNNLTDDEIETINTVLEYYGDKTPFWLREQTHDELPWKESRGNTPENERSEEIISKKSMGAYYGSL